MRELSLHLLDIAENGVSAGAQNITITIVEDLRADRLQLTVEDDGRGMDAAMVEQVTNPFITTRTTRKVGLGIPLLKLAAEMCNGGLTVESTPNVGTTVKVDFQRSHIDRMPLGDVAGTMLSLLIGWPQVHWVLRYRVDDEEFVFDDAPIKEELGDALPLSDPEVIGFLRGALREGIADVTKRTRSEYGMIAEG
jgi:anti-sigma regulatory factor (Ser/Thr protein kinase)